MPRTIIKISEIIFDKNLGCLEDDFFKQRMEIFNINKMELFYKYQKHANQNNSVSNKENTFPSRKQLGYGHTHFHNKEILKALQSTNNEKSSSISKSKKKVII